MSETEATATETAASPAIPAKRPAPWRGRRRVPDPKDKFIAVRCTAEAHAVYDAAATAAGLSIGAWLRALADGTPGPRAVRRPPVEKEALARLLGEIGKLGSNVNQLARAANMAVEIMARNELAAITGDILARDELVAIADEVRAMRSALMQALGRGN